MNASKTSRRARAAAAATAIASFVFVQFGAPAYASAEEAPVATGLTVSVAPFPAGVTRLSGADRYETAAVTAQRYAPGVPAVFVATGTNFPDALSAAAAAARLGGPLLLTMPGALPASTATELDRLNPAQIYIVGGTNAVSAAVASQVAAYGPVTRISGSDRFATGRAITQQAFQSATSAVIATGRNFPDALAATGLAGSKSAPVILVEGGAPALPTETLGLLVALGVTQVYVAGGPNAVSAGIASQLSNAGMSVTRYAGADRYSTAAAINDANFGTSIPVTFLATGTNFPDALAGAALAGGLGAPLYITRKDCTPLAINDSINLRAATSRVVLGGTGAVSENAAANNSCDAGSPPPPPPPPGNPGDSKNCSDFDTWREAQDWFELYFPQYGDVAKLDQDNNGIACESLPGR